jgi:hypothetical protein
MSLHGVFLDGLARVALCRSLRNGLAMVGMKRRWRSLASFLCCMIAFGPIVLLAPSLKAEAEGAREAIDLQV